MRLPCDLCGKRFVKNHRAKRFCSRRCKERAKEQRRQATRSVGPVEGSCQQCGSSFVGSALRVYCSQKCRDAAKYERQKASGVEARKRERRKGRKRADR